MVRGAIPDQTQLMEPTCERVPLLATHTDVVNLHAKVREHFVLLLAQ
jgi:hypothetical protein